MLTSEMETRVDMDEVLLRFRGTTSSQDQQDLLSIAKLDKKRPLSGPLMLRKKNRTETPDRTAVPTIDLFRMWPRTLIRDSITNFQTGVKLRIQRKSLLQSADGTEILDPRFALMQIWHLLSARNLVDCEMFVKRGGLSYILVALSSCQPCIRRVAYSTLQRFYRQLESLPHNSYKDRQLWLNFTDVLRSALTTENQQLRRLRTAFYSNAIPLIQKPDNLLFGDVRQIFLNSSHSDADIASELIRFLKSAHPKNHSDALHWSLVVMSEGLDQKEDFDLLDKRGFVDLLVNFCSSPLLTSFERQRILIVIEKASRIKEAARLMCSRNALISFMNGLVLDESIGDDLLTVFQISCNLSKCWTEDLSQTPSSSIALELCGLLLCLSRHASHVSERSKNLSVQYVDQVFKVIALVGEHRQSFSWLSSCESDLEQIRSLNCKLDATRHSELAVADESIAL